MNDTLFRRLPLRIASAGLIALLTWSLAARADTAVPELPSSVRQADYLLLGEVHDNPAGHALRRAWLRALFMSRPSALAMEQFDVENQSSLEAALDHARNSGRPADPDEARRVAEAGKFNFRGWRWPLYEPVLALALAQGVPLYPANLSRKSLGEIMGGQQPLPPEPDRWSEAQRAALLHEVKEGHCNLMPESQLPLLAGAQRARDLTMAQALVALHRKTGRPVILLAGNGHLRNDLAVPVWLHQLDPEAKVASVAVLERDASPEDSPPEKAFDAVYWVARTPRPDPCDALRKRFGKP
jgi:uncharacterized iron-regulated protein